MKTIAEARPAYDAIVIGSGYGGGVAASRLARMGFRVAVLEQGRNWRPGEFPTTALGKCRSTRLTGRVPDFGNPSGLYYLSVGHGLTVFGASGLGGGSLINAGVALRPDASWLRRSGWPAAVLDDGLFDIGLQRAEMMLGVMAVPHPSRFAKLEWMKKAALASGYAIRFPVMTIAHQAGTNKAGVVQYACRNCGDCWSGCNLGSKNTIAITYLADAADHGAEIFCESRAQSIAKTANGWRVEVKDLAQTNLVKSIEASILVLAAGTMGTNALLLKAQDDGLALSARLGQRFSANGDDLVIASELPEPVNAIALGFPSRAPLRSPCVGPHSAAMIDAGDESGPLWIHDGTMLTMMARLAPLRNILQLQFRKAVRHLTQGVYGADLSRTQLLYVVAHDDAGGRLRFANGRAVVEWPQYSDAPARVTAEQKVRLLVEKTGGKFAPNPFAMTAFGGNRIIAHPLGGAAMGETADQGVVDPAGRVFNPSQGPVAVHDGLYVCDGAAIPSAVGVSPLLTITALAERAMILAARTRGRTLDVDATPPRPARDAVSMF